MAYKVVYTDNIYKDSAIEIQRFKEAGYEFVITSDHTEDVLCQECKDADALMVSYAEVTKKVIDSLEKCKVIIRTGMGVNNVDIPAATAKGIMVANCQKYCSEEVSDHALALMLTLIRKTAYMDQLIAKGVWDASLARPIPRIGDLTLCLYGLGEISSRVAVKAQALGMKVLGYDPYVPEARFKELGVEMLTEESELFTKADVLSVHLPLMDSTAGIISYDKLKMMKPSAYFINVARGGLVDEPGLIRILQEKGISGAGLDVLVEEYPSMDNPLFAMDNVVVTPHIAYYSEGSDKDLRNITIDQVIQTFEEGEPRFILNKKDLAAK